MSTQDPWGPDSHTTSPTSPVVVTGAKQYRPSFGAIIPATSPDFTALTDALPPKYRPTRSFGVIGYESPEHSTLWVGGIKAAQTYRADPAGFRMSDDFGQGFWTDLWPNTPEWLQVIPRATWNPDGQGVVQTFHHDDGGEVVVYELLDVPVIYPEETGHRDGDTAPVVTWHCARCHLEGGSLERFLSYGPDARRQACRAARQHLLPDECKGAESLGLLDRAAAAVSSVVRGSVPVDPASQFAGACAIATGRGGPSSCREVREAKAHTARHASAGSIR